MTASGSIDTNDLTPVAPESWGGISIEENAETDIMGDTASGSTDAHFGFSAGTDYGAWDSPTGPFANSNFTGPPPPHAPFIFTPVRAGSAFPVSAWYKPKRFNPSAAPASLSGYQELLRG